MGRVASTDVELIFLGIGKMVPILSIGGRSETNVHTRVRNINSQFARIQPPRLKYSAEQLSCPGDRFSFRRHKPASKSLRDNVSPVSRAGSSQPLTSMGSSVPS